MASSTQKRPLTAYQKQRRKELGLEDEEELSIDQQLARVEVDIRRLKVEFDIFFNGGTKHPPYETKNKVETALTRLGDDRSLTYAHRYKYNSLAARFAGFRDLWRRSLQNREEGRDFITVARAKLEAMRKAADEEIASRNKAAARLLAQSLANAKGAAANPAPPPPLTEPLVAPPASAALAHREPVRIKSPSSLLGLSEERGRPVPPPAAAPEAFDTAPAVNETAPVNLAPPALHLVSEPEAPVLTEADAETEALGAESLAVDDGGFGAAVMVPLDLTGDGLPADESQPVAEFEETAADDQDEYLGAVFDTEPGSVQEPGTTDRNESEKPADAEPAEVAGESPSLPIVSDENRDPAGVERDIIRPLGMSFPKILPPNAHQLTPPEPAKQARRADDRREGDRRSGDRRALPFGRRSSDREATAGLTSDEVVAQYVKTESAPAKDIEPQAANEVRVEQESVRQEQETVRVNVSPVPQVQLPPVETGSEAPAASVVADEEVAAFTFNDPRREPAKVKELFAVLVNAKIKTGENSDDLLPSRFGHLLALRADKIRKSAKCDQVTFSVAIEGGRVNLNARAAG